MTKVNAPFTDDQVNSINGYQRSKWYHPFTCGKVHCDGILTATKHGIVCRKCGNWTQYWVHDFMANWGWKQFEDDIKLREKYPEDFRQ